MKLSWGTRVFFFRALPPSCNKTFHPPRPLEKSIHSIQMTNTERAVAWLTATDPIIQELRRSLYLERIEWGFSLPTTHAQLEELVKSSTSQKRLLDALSAELGSHRCSHRSLDSAVRFEVRRWAKLMMANQAESHSRSQYLGLKPRLMVMSLPQSEGDRSRGLDAARHQRANMHATGLHRRYIDQVFSDL